jgi:large subunit ribosomal protein L15
MPLQRRVPKRGFTNPFRKTFQVVNLKDLERVKGDEIDRVALRESGLIRSLGKPVKILGEGSIERKVTVRVDAFSEAARRAIEAAGGSCVEEQYVPETEATETTETGA